MKEDTKDLIRGIFGIVFIIGFVIITFIGVKQCTIQCDTYAQNRPTYHVSYGNAWHRVSYDFETYKVEGVHYTFYDTSGSLVADITVTGNNMIDIYKNFK